jgi:hypothetical protein
MGKVIVPLMHNKNNMEEKALRLALNSGQGRDLVNYLANSFYESHQPRNLGIFIAKGWADGKASIHVHANVRIFGEAESYQFCWVFMRQWVPEGESCFDWLDMAWRPSDYIFDSWLVREGHAYQNSVVLVDVRHESQGGKYILPGWIAIGLATKPRLRLLDDCPCVPAHGI